MPSILVKNLVAIDPEAPQAAFRELFGSKFQGFRSDEDDIDIGLGSGAIVRTDRTTGQMFVYPLRALEGACITNAGTELWISLRFPNGELVLRFPGEEEKTSVRAWVSSFVEKLD